jgi:protein-tyrosine phosphatase/rhodanese-related sulfurtransferase
MSIISSSPSSPPGLHLSVCDLFNRLSGFGSLLILDIRPREAYNTSHIPRALNVSINQEIIDQQCDLISISNQLSFSDKRAFNLRQRQTVILYNENDAVPNENVQYLSDLLQEEGRVNSVYKLAGGYEAFHSKYPFLSCPVLDSRPHQHIAPFPWYPNEIIEDFIFLGSHVDAENDKHLDKLGINCILNVSAEVENLFPDKYEYLRFNIADEEEVQISRNFQQAFDLLDQCKSNNGKVLVHCHQGVSRSATIIVAYLMYSHGYTLKESYDRVKARRKQIMPNIGFWKQLAAYEQSLYQSKQSKENGEESSLSFQSTLALCVNMEELIKEKLQKLQLNNKAESKAEDREEEEEQEEEAEEEQAAEEESASGYNSEVVHSSANPSHESSVIEN